MKRVSFVKRDCIVIELESDPSSWTRGVRGQHRVYIYHIPLSEVHYTKMRTSGEAEPCQHPNNTCEGH